MEKFIETLKEITAWAAEHQAESQFPFWKNSLFFLAMIVSCAIVYFKAKQLFRRIRRRSNDEDDAFRRFAVWLFAAAAVMFLPVYYLTYPLGDKVVLFRPLLLSVHNAMRLFILDGEFDFLRDSIVHMNGVLHVVFSLYAAFIYAICPVVFTFTVIFSVFKFAFSSIRFNFHDNSPLYVFSCLNEESAAMAKSILAKARSEKDEDCDKDMIVFCGIPTNKEKREALMSLIPYVPGEDAYVLFLKDHADQLNFSRFKQNITIFLMDANEAKNIQDASALSEKLNADAARKPEEKEAEPESERKAQQGREENKREVRVLVYASSAASVPLIDAISRNRSMPVELAAKLAQAVSDSLRKGLTADELKPIIRETIKELPMPGEALRALDFSVDETYARLFEALSKAPADEKAILEGAVDRILDAASRSLVVPSGTVEILKNTIDALSERDQDTAHPRETLEAIRKTVSGSSLCLSYPFSILRVDKEAELALSIVKDILAAQPEPEEDAPKGESALTVTMLGLGGIGKEILENLLWMGQRYERKLIVNVFEATGPELGANPDAAHNPLYDRLVSEWPELIKTNSEWQSNTVPHPDTEADYDVRFFFGTDCFSNRFGRLFDAGSDVSERLIKSDAVICSLGDDDKSLRAAMMIRQLFVGKAVEAGRQKDPKLYSKPGIYAVIYDDLQADRVNGQIEMTNYKDDPYNIKAVGSMRDQFSYKQIEELEKAEKEAIVHHISWICTKTEAEDAPWLGKNEQERFSDLNRELNNYIHYEYYRRASMTKAIHKSMQKGHMPDPRSAANHDRKDPDCRCDLCRSRITEHMRWNAYMRVNGYRRFSYIEDGKLEDARNDMAKIHRDLKPWNKLPEKERVKD